jgi:hypothetical protein
MDERLVIGSDCPLSPSISYPERSPSSRTFPDDPATIRPLSVHSHPTVRLLPLASHPVTMPLRWTARSTVIQGALTDREATIAATMGMGLS